MNDLAPLLGRLFATTLSARTPAPADPSPEPVWPAEYGRPEQWPPECLQALRRYHRPPVMVCPHALLFPLLQRRVTTPQGPGVLVQVFRERAAVALEAAPGQVTFLEPSLIRPLAAAAPGAQARAA